jgi:hypothetical protein
MTARQHRVKLSPCGSGSVVPLPGRLPSHRPPGTLSADRGAGLVLAVGGTVSPVTCVDWKAKKRAKVLVADRAKCDGEEKGRERIGVPFVRLAQKQSCLKVAGGSSCSGTGPGKAQPADSPQVPCTALKQRRARDWRYPATVTKQRCPSCDHRRWPHAIPPPQSCSHLSSALRVTVISMSVQSLMGCNRSQCYHIICSISSP